MEVILISVFSAIIVFMTVFFMNKVFTIAYKRNEISRRKRIVFSLSSVVIGSLIAFGLAVFYQHFFEYIY